MTKILMRKGLVVLISYGLATAAAAVPIEVDLVPVDNSAGGPELEGFTTTDVVLTIPGLHTGSQLIIELDQGSIFQHPFGSEFLPHPAVVESYPAAAYDTYLAYGDHSDLPFG